MPAIQREQIIQALRGVNDPELHKDLVTLNMVKDVQISGSSVRVGIELTTPACPLKDQIGKDVEQALRAIGAEQVDIIWTAQVRSAPRPSGQLPGVKNIIAVGAGKGGVGKSTIAVLA